MQLDCGAVNTNTCPKPVPAEIAVSRTWRARSAVEGLLSRFRFESITVFNSSVSSCGPVAGRIPFPAASYPFIRAGCRSVFRSLFPQCPAKGWPSLQRHSTTNPPVFHRLWKKVWNNAVAGDSAKLIQHPRNAPERKNVEIRGALRGASLPCRLIVLQGFGLHKAGVRLVRGQRRGHGEEDPGISGSKPHCHSQLR